MRETFTARDIGYAVGTALIHAYKTLNPGANALEMERFGTVEGERVLTKLLADPKFWTPRG